VTREEIQLITLEILGEIAPDADLNNLDAAQSFRDQFDFDSVDYLNFVLTLEKRLEIRIPEIECPQLASLDGCIAYLAAKLGD
jgi:acyl carrier protein